MEYIFHIEGTELDALKKFMYTRNLRYEVLTKLQECITPYNHFLPSVNVIISEEELKLFLEKLEELKPTSFIKLYTKEKYVIGSKIYNYYRPFVLPIKENPFIETTFLYKQLRYPDTFYQEGITNFLEEFKITSQENNKVSGYYQSLTYAIDTGEFGNKDAGTFTMICDLDRECYKVTSKLMNIRDIIRKKNTTFDYLFDFPLENGVSTYQMTEYFLTYDEENVLHFAEGMQEIEVYRKENGKMKTKPYKVFSNDNIKDDLEKDLAKAVHEFLNQEDAQRRIYTK